MAYLDETELARRVSDALVLPISSEQLGRSEDVSIRINGLDRPSAFSIVVRAGLRLVFAETAWDTLAQNMLQSISSASEADWQQVASIRASLGSTNVSTIFEINGELVNDQFRPSGQIINSLTLRAQAVDWRESVTESAAEVVTAALAILVALLPLDLDSNMLQGKIEGLETTGQFNGYERSRANRAVAILLHGTRCFVCGIEMAERYEGVGAGYVEIHHLTPVHLMEGPALVDPRTDLVPLCPNCHRMAHRTDPPLSVSALRAVLRPSAPSH